MKKLMLTLPMFFLAVITLVACNGNSSAKGKPEGEPVVAKVEKAAATATAEAMSITREQFLTKIMDYTKGAENMKYLGDKPAIVDFWATWCGPCRIASPILDELAKEYAGKIYVYKVDTQKEQQIAGEIGIQSIPTFLFFPMDGKPFVTQGIARTPEETKKMFKDIIDNQLLKSK
ncbi:MAG: thiol reductase thioredoxin [Bacteroidales bacterium]|nr:thiol reductase thioredoxin [Bacteroidales bacterium]